MKVNIRDVKILCEKILEKTEDKYFKEVDLNFSTYWTIPFKDGQGLDSPVPKVNNLIEECDCLREVITMNKFSYLDFERLANMIKAIGVKVENLEKK